MGSKPKVIQQDPEGDARKAAEKATAEANTKKAMRRASGGDVAGGTSLLGNGEDKRPSVLATEQKKKSTLGGG